MVAWLIQREGERVELQRFSELERKINDLIGDYVALKKRISELEGLLQRKETELEEANITIGRLREERDAVRTKVDALLEMLQGVRAPETGT